MNIDGVCTWLGEGIGVLLVVEEDAGASICGDVADEGEDATEAAMGRLARLKAEVVGRNSSHLSQRSPQIQWSDLHHMLARYKKKSTAKWGLMGKVGLCLAWRNLGFKRLIRYR